MGCRRVMCLDEIILIAAQLVITLFCVLPVSRSQMLNSAPPGIMLLSLSAELLLRISLNTGLSVPINMINIISLFRNMLNLSLRYLFALAFC